MVTEAQRRASKDATLEHIKKVNSLMVRIIDDLLERAEDHDKSKLSQPELDLFAEWGPKLKEMEYGSDKYKDALSRMGEALKHHYEWNSHHPEHSPRGVNGMTLMDLVEMVCDWLAASERMKDGDIIGSLKHNRKRFGLEPQLFDVIRNTVDYLEKDKKRDQSY